MKDYHINVFYSEEDGCYIADIPDLRFCSAFGDTPEQAVHEVMIAKEAWLASVREHGKPVPEPRYRPIIYQCMDSPRPARDTGAAAPSATPAWWVNGSDTISEPQDTEV